MIQIVQLVPGDMGHPTGHPTGLLVPNHEALFTNLPAVLQALGPDPVNVFYTLAHHAELGKEKPSRKEATFEYQTVLPFDLDHVDLSRPYDYLSLVAKVCLCEPSELTLISTGNGLHVLANLDTPIRSVKYQKELKPAYNEIIRRIARLMEVAGLPGKPDPVVFDAGRVFRLPETINRKPGDPDKFSRLIQYSDKKHKIDLMVLSGLDKLEKENVIPELIRRSFPKPDFQEMVKECRFISWALAKPEEVHEPQLFDLLSLLGPCSPSSKIEHQGREMSAREVGEAVMTGATASRSLARQDFDRKWDDSTRYGARKCSTVAKNWLGGCQTCPHNGRIPTPLALRSPEHIGSEDNGFWVMGKNGPTHPDYDDLSRVYARERCFVVTEEERLFNFIDNSYVESGALPVKSWLEKRVNPVQPLRESHCMEFVKKVHRVGAMTKAAEEELFTRATTGKLNCRNGVVNILTGELLPHDPKYGFQYVLPFEYASDISSPLFMEWLGTITKNRSELIDVILDMMAYCLWPTYDDHVFFCLVGTGANGKSTLLHIIQELLGKGNFSAVSMQQLGRNRFSPANLEGKLANLSEESSGYEMDYEELNVLQNLSAGGDMEVERKGTQGFTFRNKAKLIFSANKPPRFKDTGHALRRRMVVIPFDYTIVKPDADVESKLIAEAPAIVSMLVRRIQENTALHNGRFKVSRGGEAVAEAQEKILLGGNTVVEWSRDWIESSENEEGYVVIADAYMAYKKWCEASSYQPMNLRNFSHAMYNSVLTSALDKEDNRMRVNGKQIRVFKKTKWKETLI